MTYIVGTAPGGATTFAAAWSPPYGAFPARVDVIEQPPKVTEMQKGLTWTE